VFMFAVAWAVLALLPRARTLSDSDMGRIAGGKITNCQGGPVQQKGGNGWYCNAAATYSCDALCEPCYDLKNQKTMAQCLKLSDWQCDPTQNPVSKLQECYQHVAQGSTNDTCTDFGAGNSPCGPIYQATCSWEYCETFKIYMCFSTTPLTQTSERCPRANCSAP
jgi:hypothetical protein